MGVQGSHDPAESRGTLDRQEDPTRGESPHRAGAGGTKERGLGTGRAVRSVVAAIREPRSISVSLVLGADLCFGQDSSETSGGGGRADLSRRSAAEFSSPLQQLHLTPVLRSQVKPIRVI